MRSTTLMDVQVGVTVMPLPDGSRAKAIIVTDPAGAAQWIIPLPDELARKLAAALTGGVEVARVVPPSNGHPGGGART